MLIFQHIENFEFSLSRDDAYYQSVQNAPSVYIHKHHQTSSRDHQTCSRHHQIWSRHHQIPPHMHHVWLVWSKTSHSWDEWRCHRYGRTTEQQANIELLSFWSVNRWVSQIRINLRSQDEHFFPSVESYSMNIIHGIVSTIFLSKVYLVNWASAKFWMKWNVQKSESVHP